MDDIDLTTVEDPVLGQLLRAKHREMELQLDMLEARDTEDFLPLSVELYGGVSPALRKQAEALLSGITRTEPTDEPLDAEAFLELAEAEIARYRDEDPDLDMHADPYQKEVSYRIIESLVLQDAEEITALQARQSGKSEVVATTLAGCMILFPLLAKTYPIMERFRDGLWIGLFAPVEEQSALVYGRIIDRLSSERAQAILKDPEIAQRLDAKSKVLKLSNGSLCRRQTANPRAKIEGSTYHVIVIDECQDADENVVRKSIHPMLASTAGTMVKIGTPGYHKGDFYKAIHLNKRRARGKRKNHFEYD